MSEMVKNQEARPEVDRMLRDYFQSELPRPWPAFRAPRSARINEAPSLWSRCGGRIALAACITLLAAGYLSLAGYFPRLQPNTGVQEIEHIGQNPDGKKSPERPQPVPMDNR
jgi:hypothetical protein